MQGRIALVRYEYIFMVTHSKVLHMKPSEILGLVEEAAGTRMYETKKHKALQQIEKKKQRVEEINRVNAFLNVL